MMEYTEAKIQKLIFCEFADRAIVIPNCYHNSSRWEMDCLVVTTAGLSYEYEIKLTHSDFLNEMKHKELKHRYMGMSTHICSNYFSFICPENVINVEEIWNDNYGLFYVNGYYMKAVRKPKKLHDARVPEKTYRKFAKKLMYKYFNHADKYRVRKGVR